MDVGLFAMPLHPPGSNITQTLDDDLDMLITLEQMGYSEAWIGEHFTTQWENIPAPDLFHRTRAGENGAHEVRDGRDLHAQPQPVHDRPPDCPA